MKKKRIILIFLLLLSLSNAFAQLNITNTNSSSERFYKDTWVSVTWNGTAFMFNSSDPRTALTLSFVLGKDKGSALKSLCQIYDWFNAAEKQTSITFVDGGHNITIYKPNGLEMVITTGDAEYARKEHTRRNLGAVAGMTQYSKKEATPHFSFIRPKALETSIKVISEIDDPKYIGASSQFEESTSRE